MGHEVGDAFEHAPRLEHERWERDLLQVHADSAQCREWRVLGDGGWAGMEESGRWRHRVRGVERLTVAVR